MSEGAIIVAIITVIGSVAAAYVTARNETAKQLTEHGVKLNLLWAVYVEDAVKDARESGLAQRNSPPVLTEKWDDIVTEELREQIQLDLAYWIDRLGSAYDASIEVYRMHQGALSEVARQHDIRHKAIVGALYLQAKSIKRQEN